MSSHIALIRPVDASEGSRLHQDLWEPEAGGNQETCQRNVENKAVREREGNVIEKYFS